MKKYLTKILFASMLFVYSGVLAGAPLDSQLLDNSKNAEQDFLRERIQEQGILEIQKSTEKLNVSIEEHLGLYSEKAYFSPTEEIAILTGEEDTETAGPFPVLNLIAVIDNALRATVTILPFIKLG